MSTSVDPPLENEGHESLVLLAEAELRREAKSAAGATAESSGGPEDRVRCVTCVFVGWGAGRCIQF